MSETTYTFDHSIAAESGDRMAQVTTQIQSELDDLDAMVQKQLASWEAEDRDNYTQHKAEWDNAAVRMHAHLGVAVNGLAQIAGEYLNVTKAGVRIWDGYTVK